MKNDKRTQFFETNVKNAELIKKIGGILPIRGSHIGEIKIDKKGKTATIELKQCAEPQIIAFYEGKLFCRDVEYELIETKMDGGVFIFNKDKENPNRYELQINNNRQGIIIKCSDVELTEYKKIEISTKQYQDLFIKSLSSQFFSIKIND